MDESEVIDIDDLLGSAVALGQQEAEEYDFENFPNDSEPTPTPETSIKETVPDYPSSNLSVQQGGLKQNSSPVRNAQSKTPLEEELKKLFLTSKSSKRKVEIQEQSLAINNNVPERGEQSYSDSKASQNEALVDALIQGGSTDGVLSDEELSIDVNSEELRQFILEFEASNDDIPPKSSSPEEGRRPKQRVVINHRYSQSDDQDSLNSSISTTESRDGSLTSSLASSDIHLSPVRTKQKVPRGKTVRFLMSNLLRNNKAPHHHSGRTSGSDDDSRDSKTRPTKERNKKKDKEERDRDRIANKHSKHFRSQQVSISSGKFMTSSAANGQARRPGDLPQDGKTQSRVQLSTATVAMPVSPGARDNTLPKQLIQAATRGDLQVLEFLLAANEGLSQVRDNRGNTLLHAVARRGHVDCLTWLASWACAGLLAVENDDCFTAAALAVKHGQLACLTWMVQHSEAKSELHSQDNRWSLLHLAARFGQEPCLRRLLELMQMQDISLDQTDHSNNSPSHLSAKYGHLPCLQTLVEYNCDVTLLNKKKQSPFSLATRYHHVTCAQFLVVVETCIKLSNELTVTQRQFRESQQEKEAMSKKLREALSCTDALVHMQKTDLSQRIEQVRGEYVDLTNLLVHQLDQLHKQQTRTNPGNQLPASTSSEEDVLVYKQKATQLEQACSDLQERDQRQEEEHGNQDQLLEIERRLSRLQPLPTSPIWPAPATVHNPGLALDSMRTRLSEVNHQIATLHHVSPSLASDNLDTLSLSSSYASSLSSSSSSSLMAAMVQSSPGHSAKKRRVSWNEELSQKGSLDQEEIFSKTCVANSKTTLLNNYESNPPDLSLRSTECQRSSHVPMADKKSKDFTSKLYSKEVGPVRCKTALGNQSHSKTNILHVQAEINRQETELETLESPTSTSYAKPSAEDRGRNSTPPPSYLESCSRHLSSSHSSESIVNRDDTSKRKTGEPPRNADRRKISLDHVDQKSPATITNSSPGEKLEMPEAYFFPTFDKLSTGLEESTSQQQFAPQKHRENHAMPDFMRKVQRTNQFGEPEAGKVIVKISNREELVLLPPGTSGSLGDLSASHHRLNSNSSLSSISSDLPWSESETDESPRPNRQPVRGGILSKKTTDGSKKTQEKHIKFALGDVDDKPTASSVANPAAVKPHPSKRRDLSPIYEAPDLLKSTSDDSKKSQNEKKDAGIKSNDKTLANTQKNRSEKLSPEIKTDNDCQRLKVPQSKKLEATDRDDKSSSRRRNFRLFSYSSDEGDHEGESSKTGKTLSESEHENLKYPACLTDALSQEFNGIKETPINGDIDAVQYKLWYEMSEDDEDQDDNQLQLQSSGGFERHICYL
ncbi:uncharacterized protein LOC117287786 [Asterias rubens]|uniref:uncharacterized protein LOC117287786 n=1 Tax=Asterias rubens TaxID=7604 RepID=UPI001455C4EB|nr:uncharacterized protein LOC117287786 [Asterias rubens]